MAFRIVAVLLVALIGQLGSGSSQLPPASELRSAIGGIVVRAGTGEPVRRAEVTLRRVAAAPSGPALVPAPGAPQTGQRGQQQGPAQRTVTTADDGTFLFTEVPPGQYRIAVARDGYISQEYGQRSWTGQGANVSVDSGQRITTDFHLVPAGTITGRVYDEFGDPLIGVQVQALTYVYQNGARTLAPARQVQTNDLGEYRLHWLTPGEYYISALPNSRHERLLDANSGLASVPPGLSQTLPGGAAQNAELLQRIQTTTSSQSYAPIYYPGGIDPDYATPVTLSAASDLPGIDFMIRPVYTATIRGAVAGDAPPPAQPAAVEGQRGGGQRGGGNRTTVVLNRIQNMASGGVRTGGGRGLAGLQFRGNVNANGAFEIRDVIPGSYNVMAIQQSQGRISSARTRIEVTETGIDNLYLNLRPGVEIAGQVYVDGQAPQQFQMQRVRVTLTPTENLPSGNATAQVGEDGRFTLSNVAVGMTYRVGMNNLSGGGYLLDGRYGGADPLGDLLQVNDAGIPLQLQIGFSPGRIEGTATAGAGDPFMGAIAVLVPSAPGRIDLYRTASTDQYGRFSFTNVVPGDYRVFAWEDLPQGAYQDPVFLSRFETRGRTVHVDQGGVVSAQVTVIASNGQ